MKTKDRILATALELYNENSFAAISTRTIAKKLNMSGGNLHYHFKHSEDIITELFDKLKAEMDLLMEDFSKKEIKDLSVFFDFAENAHEIFYKYRFIFLNFNEILRSVPSIEKTYSELEKRRMSEFLKIFKNLQEQEIFEMNIPGFFWENLVTQIFIVGDYWMLHNTFTLKLSKEDSLQHYLKVFMQLFYGVLKEDHKKSFLTKLAQEY